MKVSVVITSYNEEKLIGRCLQSIQRGINYSKDRLNSVDFEIIVVAPDEPTLNNARQFFESHKESPTQVLQDESLGKWNAMNMAYEAATGEIVVFTDGDVYVDDDSIYLLIRRLIDDSNLSAVGGHPVSIDDINHKYGFYSHLFCEAAHKVRLQQGKYTPMSGYLFAVRKLEGLFPLPKNLRAEDAFISLWIATNNMTFGYEPESKVFVKFPDNFHDWMAQKTRSLGGNVQLSKIKSDYKLDNPDSQVHNRSLFEDLKMMTFPFRYAKNQCHIWFAVQLYVLRLILWIKIYYIHIRNRYPTGAWQRIPSTKV